MLVKGINGQIDFDGVSIKITRKGGLAFATHALMGEKVIPVAQILSVQYKEASRLVNGFIHFATASTSSINNAAFLVADPNTVIFKIAQKDEFAQLRSAAEEAVEKSRSVEKSGADESPLDALKKLKDLFDSGVITENEYNDKKTLLMNKI